MSEYFNMAASAKSTNQIKQIQELEESVILLAGKQDELYRSIAERDDRLLRNIKPLVISMMVIELTILFSLICFMFKHQ